MADLETDDEKVEAIKAWWKANGLSVFAGVAIGLGAVFAWRGWVNYHTSVAQRASIAFEQLLATSASDGAESVQMQAKAINDDYGSTPYAMFADLAVAKVRVDAGELEAATKALESAIAQAPEPGLAKLAALRLARVLISRGEFAQATKVIDAHDDGGAFAADFSALRGDIAAAEGRTDAARTAYQTAIDGGAGDASLIELKLRDLPAEGQS
jgi:predicted negative regulator of RcsB-dependent stress response